MDNMKKIIVDIQKSLKGSNNEENETYQQNEFPQAQNYQAHNGRL